MFTTEYMAHHSESSAPVLLPETVQIHGAAVIPGRGRGKALGIATINIDFSSVPKSIRHGIYACWVTINGERFMGAMHYGPRPVFNDTETMEVHVIDMSLETIPKTVDLAIVGFVRPVMNFPSPEALVARIHRDILETRAMLGKA